MSTRGFSSSFRSQLARSAHAIGISLACLVPPLAWAGPGPGPAQPLDPQPGVADSAQAVPPAQLAHPSRPQVAPADRYNPDRGAGKVAFGFTMFGASYVIATFAAASLIEFRAVDLGRPLLIPVVGPFIAGSRAPTATFGVSIALDGVVQLAGLGLGIAGAVQLGKARRNAPRLSVGPGGLQLQF